MWVPIAVRHFQTAIPGYFTYFTLLPTKWPSTKRVKVRAKWIITLALRAMVSMGVCMYCQVVQRRVDLLVSEGIEFQTGVTVGKDISARQLLDDFDAVVLCMGSTWPRDLNIPGMILYHWHLWWIDKITSEMIKARRDCLTDHCHHLCNYRSKFLATNFVVAAMFI